MLKQLNTQTQFENDGEKSRMVIEVDGDTPVIEFQVDMIRNNRIPGLLPLELRRVDSKIRMYYDVTGKWRLKDLLDNKEFTGEEFVTLLERLIQVLTGADAYLLDIAQFVLEEEYLFIEGNLEPRLLYLPIKGSQNIHTSFKDLLLQLVVYRARLRDQDSGAVLSGILNYLKREDFNLFEFQKALRTLVKAGSPGVSSQAVTAPEQVHKPMGPVSLSDLIPQENRQSAPPVIPSKAPPQKKAPAPKSVKANDQQRYQTVTEYKTKTKYKASVGIAIIIFQVVLAAGVLFGFKPVYQATEDITTAYAALGLMVLCLDGLVLKNLLKPENKVEVQIPMKKKVKAPEQNIETRPPQEPSSSVQPAAYNAPVYPVNYDKQVISNAQPHVSKAAVYDTEVLTPNTLPGSGSYDTVVLSHQVAAPYLVRKGPVQEIIRLNKPATVLGRQGDMADHVIDDPAIGRMHAELIWNGTLCQVRDLNSKNGTFVNGQRLSGPQPMNLSIGDEIKLGPLEYTLAQD